MGQVIFEHMMEIAFGKKSKSEELGSGRSRVRALEYRLGALTGAAQSRGSGNTTGLESHCARRAFLPNCLNRLWLRHRDQGEARRQIGRTLDARGYLTAA